ncbi:hypothetical protein SAMN05877809_102263 [Rhodobacter sp. JA431]|uniref:hypothetical protein n=1 Tax=Rhodobacter sp. JA431 TaxID=570013 RepID=UPI000BCF9E64|nr:hypothetical protein [Rhodobacter sp. JA431]SOB98485.1 hypothetical protein SAMN05877809_102263 [Rhodobacter sp. JA431]
MKQTPLTLAALAIAFASFAPAAMANPPQDCSAPGARCAAPGHNTPPGHAKKQAPQAAKQAPGHAPSSAQLRRLPPPPHGQEYRVVDNRVVLIDSDTLNTMAVLGLLTALLNN